MGAPPDHQSDRQVDLRVSWKHDGADHAAILRFIVLRTNNLRIILGLNAILFAGLLDPLVSTLRDMQLEARSSEMLYLAAPDSAPDIPTYSLHMTQPVEPDPPSTGSGAPIVGAGMPPNAVPFRAQVLKPARLLVTPDPTGLRHELLCPLFRLDPDELATWPEALLDHDVSLQRFIRGDQLSYVPTFRPFYWMDLNNDLHHAAESPPTVQPNYNGRYTIWHGVAIWQWGVFNGSSDCLRFTPYNSYEDVMRFLNPLRYNTLYWPSSFGRVQNALLLPPGPAFPEPTTSHAVTSMPTYLRLEDSRPDPTSSSIGPTPLPGMVPLAPPPSAESQVSPAAPTVEETPDPFEPPASSSDDSPSTPEVSPPSVEPPDVQPPRSRKRRRRLRPSRAGPRTFRDADQSPAPRAPLRQWTSPEAHGPSEGQLPSVIPPLAPQDDSDTTVFADILIKANPLPAGLPLAVPPVPPTNWSRSPCPRLPVQPEQPQSLENSTAHGLFP